MFRLICSNHFSSSEFVTYNAGMSNKPFLEVKTGAFVFKPIEMKFVKAIM